MLRGPIQYESGKTIETLRARIWREAATLLLLAECPCGGNYAALGDVLDTGAMTWRGRRGDGVPRMRAEIEEIMMGRGQIVDLDTERRKRRNRVGPLCDSALLSPSLDPWAMAIGVCREMDVLSKRRNQWIPVRTLCKRLNLSRHVVVGAAVYGHVRGWVTCTSSFSLLLRDEGRALLLDLERQDQPSLGEVEAPSPFLMPLQVAIEPDLSVGTKAPPIAGM